MKDDLVARAHRMILHINVERAVNKALSDGGGVEEVVAAVRHAFQTRQCADHIRSVVKDTLDIQPVTYAAGFRVDGKMVYFNGPLGDIEDIVDSKPPDSHNTKGKQAFIVRIVGATVKPVARWRDGEWQMKK